MISLVSNCTFAPMQFPALTIWQKIIHWDIQLFETINTNASNPFFDLLMPVLRNPLTWAPLYLFLALFMLINFRYKGAWWILFIMVTAAITDMTGNLVFKHGFERLRPCNDPLLEGHVRLLLKYCGSGYSFISNHAANHFGMAAFLFFTLRHLFKKWIWLAFLWAGSIGYAQVYVGVHYPSDIGGGMVLGIIAGTFTGLIFNKYFSPVLRE